MSEIKTLNGYSLADTKAREDIATLSKEIANKKGLTSAQITALDNMFKVCAYASSAETAYAAFCAAFGITGGGTGGDSGEGSDEVNVYFADYSDWPTWGNCITTISNGFSVDSPVASSGAAIAVGIIQGKQYGDLKGKTLKFSCDLSGEIESGALFPFNLRSYTDVPKTSYSENSAGYITGGTATKSGHFEWSCNLQSATWNGETPKDTDYLGYQFYCKFVGTATITNFRVEVV